jgi:hypothetical protein
MIRAVIFDLDNCVSAADEPGKEFLEPVFDTIRRASKEMLNIRTCVPVRTVVGT